MIMEPQRKTFCTDDYICIRQIKGYRHNKIGIPVSDNVLWKIT